jgi:hypothetical protein
MRFEHKLFPLGCQEMIAKGSHIRDGGATEEALKPQLSGFQVSSLRGHGELGKEPIGADSENAQRSWTALFLADCSVYVST